MSPSMPIPRAAAAWRAAYGSLRFLLLAIFVLSSVEIARAALGISPVAWLQSNADQPLLLAVAFMPLAYMAVWRLSLKDITNNVVRRLADVALIVGLVAVQLWASTLIPVVIW